MVMDPREYIHRLQIDGHTIGEDFLSRFDDDGKDTEIAGQPDPLIVQRGIDAVGD